MAASSNRLGRIVAGVVAGVGLLFASVGAGAAAFGFDDVAAVAAALARRPHVEPPADERLARLSYDAYRSIRFRPERALWQDPGSAWQVHFYPLGRQHGRALQLHEVIDGRARALQVPAEAFRNDGAPGVAPLPGAAGWRLNTPLNVPGRSDELIVFLGASYFRAVAKDLHYGLSARGLAIDTVGGAREEFPAFTRFWLERPTGTAQARFWALLESPRATGAYEFVVRPGVVTTIDVRARIHLRSRVARLGIAPLTSMFFSGENQPAVDDYRPEVHDSDGLQIAFGDGEWLWRPLVNPRGVFVTAFEARGLHGFGLMQRDRLFSHYEDLEARYEQRPSAWVEPRSDWGAGRVELLQFGTPDETNDNIAAYWVPQTLPEPGQPLDIAWRIHIGGDGLARPPGARVVQSRRGHGWRPEGLTPEHLQFHVDFDGPGLEGLADDAVQAAVSGNDNVRGLRAIVQPNRVSGGWRATIDLERLDPRRPVELRAFLRGPRGVLSETWSYALPPE